MSATASDRLGDCDGRGKGSTNQTLYRYQPASCLATARIELFYCGSADCARVEEALLRPFAGGAARASGSPSLRSPSVWARPTRPREITETMDVTQGEARHGLPLPRREDTPAHAAGEPHLRRLLSNSKLFLNVREKLSLCYYASCRLRTGPRAS